MRIAIMQPYLFPYIGYFQLIASVDKFIVYDDVNYINRGWINRNKILSNGLENLLVLPLEGASQNKLINEINIVDNESQVNKILKRINESYKKAPYFQMVYPVVEGLLKNKERNLSKFILQSLYTITEFLKIDTQIIPSSTIYRNSALKGQIRILDICQKEKASHYINPVGGMEIYSNQLFEDHRVELSFLKSNEIYYNQNGIEFIPWLSIIDVMMFNSVDTIKSYLTEYKLIKQSNTNIL